MPGTTAAAAAVKSPVLAVAFTSAVAVTVLWRVMQRRRRSEPNDAWAHDDLVLSVHRSGADCGPDPQDECIYLDYNGTTPIYPEVLEAMMPYLTRHFGNPSSGHVYGDAPFAAIATARKQILEELLGVNTLNGDDDSSVASAIVFTACGTEADNLAIHWALQQPPQITKLSSWVPHVVTCNVEHPAIEQCLKAYAAEGRAQVTFVPVGTDGRVTYRDMVAAIQSNTVLVTLMLANNETGALQPVKEVSEYCRRKGILFHTDAAQAAGKVSCRLEDLGHPDLVTLVGHKIGAPKGISCLYVRPGCLMLSGDPTTQRRGLLLGGGQEQGRRAGTENVPYIVGFGVAAAHSARHLAVNQDHMERLRHRLLKRLQDGLSPQVVVRVNGPTHPAQRLPNTLSIGFGASSSSSSGQKQQPIHSGRLLAAIRTQVAASAGATCHSADGPVSSILRAMQVPDEYARATVRLSVGPKTTAEHVDRAAAILIDQVLKQQQQPTESKPQ